MSLTVSYVGDSLTAAGFGLAGVVSYATDTEPGAVWAALMNAREQSDVVILSQECALGVADRLAALLLRRPTPPVVVVPSIDADGALEDESIGAARRVLGIG